jgi:hypothetical protein
MIKLWIKHKLIETAIETLFNKISMNFNKSKISIQCNELNDSHLGMRIVGIDPRNKYDFDGHAHILDDIIGHTISKIPYRYTDEEWYGNSSSYMAEYKHGTNTGYSLYKGLIIIIE